MAQDEVLKREGIYQISTNRGQARHRVRYVESSAPPEGECRLCVGTLPSVSAQSSAAVVSTAQANDNKGDEE